ncbi:hypothetical protein Sste5346_005645 [Sporothrix stenoceras]|uniref:F-box domain-containing protein n=1 Tax=Sporothrix stenoceras TaxID=5173 RepID=A0ABR3Z4F0_9PEZI
MDAFLAAALAPKARNKRKAQNGNNDSSRDGASGAASGNGSQTGPDGDAKRPRPRGASLAKETTETKTVKSEKTEKTEMTNKTTTTTTVRTKTTTTDTPQPMLSFLDTISGQGAAAKGPTRTRLIIEKAKKLLDTGHQKDLINAHKLLPRALIACDCHAQLRSQFKEAGAPLDAIDPIGRCSCRDFVAAAQTRRPQTMTGGFGGPPPVAGDGIPFPISQLDMMAVYSLATDGPACSCGSGRIRCSLPDHLEALARLATVSSKLGFHDEAKCVGEWYMDLAPERPEGYLQVAMAVLDMDKKKKKDGRLKTDVAREQEQTRFAARCIYAHGLHNVRMHGGGGSGGNADPADSKLFKMLDVCSRRYSFNDYLPDLPVETVEAIFQHLSLSDILACRRVSRRWALVLKRVRLRPAQVRFWATDNKKEAPIKGLQSLLRQMPDLKTNHLSIRYPKSTDWLRTAKFVTLALNHFKDVKSLELWMWSYGNPEDDESVLPRAKITSADTEDTSTTPTIEVRLGLPPLPPLPVVSRCRHLVLHEAETVVALTPAGQMIAWASQSIETIEVHGNFSSDPFAFRMPRLWYAKMMSSRWKLGTIFFDFMAQICMAATKLEQLYLDDMAFHVTPDIDDASEDEAIPPLDEALQHLTALVIGPNCTVSRMGGGPLSHGGFLPFPSLPAGLRSLDILTPAEGLAHRIMFGSQYNPLNTAALPPDSGLHALEHLESFRCLSPVHVPAHVFQLIEPSLCRPTGRLAHLELNARDLDTNFLLGRTPNMRIPFPERMRTIGLYDFNWSSTSAGIDVLIRDRVFLDWVAQFCNAETISMYPAWRHAERTNGGTDGGRLVVALIEQALHQAEADAKKAAKEGDVKISVDDHLKLCTIYQDMLGHSMRDRCRKLIADHPVHIHSQPCRPPVFPWPGRVEER